MASCSSCSAVEEILSICFKYIRKSVIILKRSCKTKRVFIFVLRFLMLPFIASLTILVDFNEMVKT